MKFVVDTNVTIAANGRKTHANLQCQLSCIEFLEDLASPANPKQTIIDESGLILDEYTPHLNYIGQPGVGDMFFKFIHDHLYSCSKIKTVSITPVDDETRGFAELPINSLDKSDRKFLAVAITADAKIVNALDTDWHEQYTLLESLGIQINQICPQHGI